jgi:excisionase family DNA binding protein
MNHAEDIKRLAGAFSSLASTITEIIDGRLKSIPPVVAEHKRANMAVPSEGKGGLPRLAFTMQETADILGVSYKTVHRLLQRGLLKGSRALRHKIIPRTEIERFLKETME